MILIDAVFKLTIIKNKAEWYEDQLSGVVGTSLDLNQELTNEYCLIKDYINQQAKELAQYKILYGHRFKDDVSKIAGVISQFKVQDE